MGELNLAAETYNDFIETAGPDDYRIKTVETRIGELKGQIK